MSFSVAITYYVSFTVIRSSTQFLWAVDDFPVSTEKDPLLCHRERFDICELERNGNQSDEGHRKMA